MHAINNNNTPGYSTSENSSLCHKTGPTHFSQFDLSIFDCAINLAQIEKEIPALACPKSIRCIDQQVKDYPDETSATAGEDNLLALRDRSVVMANKQLFQNIIRAHLTPLVGLAAMRMPSRKFDDDEGLKRAIAEEINTALSSSRHPLHCKFLNAYAAWLASAQQFVDKHQR